jgi:hypothetical protein
MTYPLPLIESLLLAFSRARICKRLRSPRIDSEESIPGILKRFTNTGLRILKKNNALHSNGRTYCTNHEATSPLRRFIRVTQCKNFDIIDKYIPVVYGIFSISTSQTLCCALLNPLK